jgi:hypothetical protein
MVINHKPEMIRKMKNIEANLKSVRQQLPEGNEQKHGKSEGISGGARQLKGKGRSVTACTVPTPTRLLH